MNGTDYVYPPEYERTSDADRKDLFDKSLLVNYDQFSYKKFPKF